MTADYLAKALGGATVVVENRGGAGGIVGTDAVARAEPDGHTLCVCSIGSITVSPSLETLPYDPLVDLAPVSPLSGSSCRGESSRSTRARGTGGSSTCWLPCSTASSP